MKLNLQALDNSWLAIKWCGLLTLIYILFVLFLPLSRGDLMPYHLSALEYRIILLLISIPLVAIWFIAFWGYAKLSDYARSVEKTKEGKHFFKLAHGLAWLAWSLPIAAIANQINTSIDASHSAWHNGFVILNNYLELALPLVAFIIIGLSAKGLVDAAKINLNLHSARVIMGLFIILGSLYCYLTLRAIDLSSLSSTHNPYHLPAWLMLITIISPYLYAWFIGLLAAYEINAYSRSVKGVLYKRPLFLLTSGLSAIILSFIASQYLSNIWQNNHHLTFNIHLVIIILFRVIGGAGFLAIAIGASRLKRIEVV